MAIVESTLHLLLFDHQYLTSGNGRGGRGEESLTRHASRTQVVSTIENRENRLLTPLGLNRDFHLPFLDIEHFLASVALFTDGLPLAKYGDEAFRPHSC